MLGFSSNPSKMFQKIFLGADSVADAWNMRGVHSIKCEMDSTHIDGIGFTFGR